MNTKNDTKWRQGLQKSRQGLWGRFSQVFQGDGQIDEEARERLEEILIEADVGVDTALELVDVLKAKGDGQSPENLLKAALRERLSDPVEESFSNSKPHVILVVGVNGTGKTTTIGKLAGRYKNRGQRVLLAAGDTFRAAAGEQLETWAQRARVDIVKQSGGADPASVAYDALDAAIARGVDLLLVDTAGRLHNKANLMEELKKIVRVLNKRLESAPNEILLVLDATTGQNGLMQAKSFAETVPLTGIVLTKLDGTAKGGIVLAIQNELGIPVRYVGLGEGIDDLFVFDPDAFVHGLIG